ncbi:MAG TPA: acetyl-CoA carboxylase carboxyltransferase subunit alpha [Pyrinomonadaceae bacterium]|mgnify:FL=1|nr:acetyl-CoA carboxylase carboxyltransferase subunit alpha [Acidobacteriota bacterium]HQZ96346.1 acetyl-CoA carboxylase carboxyltransferase subunit alpha [Pyrinomonadaceae bacterium]
MATTAFERVQMARHPDRPYAMDLFTTIFTDFVEIHGDRRFSDDPAMITGFAKLDGMEVCVIGQQKGRDINERRHRNFAMSKPEGYRKALRMMYMAEKFGRPVITIIDTPGAYPGIDAEERGQAEAIAFNLREMAGLKVPIIVVVLGEGGSGGALAIGIGDKVLMMENAVYSVITPEGCAAILWKSAERAADAAEGLKLTADNLKKFDIIDEIIPEDHPWMIPADGDKAKQKAFDKICGSLKASLLRELKSLSALDAKKLLDNRYQKFRKMGEWL